LGKNWSRNEGKRGSHINDQIHKDRVIGSRITATDHELVSSRKKADDPFLPVRGFQLKPTRGIRLFASVSGMGPSLNTGLLPLVGQDPAI